MPDYFYVGKHKAENNRKKSLNSQPASYVVQELCLLPLARKGMKTGKATENPLLAQVGTHHWSY